MAAWNSGSLLRDQSQEELRRLLELSDKRPVHRTLLSRVRIDTKLEMNHV